MITLLEQAREYKMFRPIWKNLLEVPVLLGVITPMILIGIYATYSFFANFELANVFYFLTGYFIFNVLGITAGYHRYFCHKSYVLESKWKHRLLLWAGAMAGQGSPILWTAIHRGYHHRHPDTPNDPHSPIHGFWHSFILWMYKLDGEKINPKYAVDLIRDKEVVFVHTHYVKLYLAFNFVLFLISPKLFLFFSMMPAMITLITYNITNSLFHMKGLGYQNFKTNDKSLNVPILFPLVLGECWHNNHHGRPGASHFGTGASGKWWEFDPAGFIINIYKDGDSKNRLKA
jgi:stearoyl-CoA desaturase (delta-9 desaturase)